MPDSMNLPDVPMSILPDWLTRLLNYRTQDVAPDNGVVSMADMVQLPQSKTEAALSLAAMLPIGKLGRKAGILSRLAEADAPRAISEAEMGGKGLWISPKGEVVDLSTIGGRAAHRDYAEKLTGKSMGDAYDQMFNQGWVRVRGDAVEAHPSALNSLPFMMGVDHAKQGAAAKGKDSIYVANQVGNATVPLDRLGDFLRKPAAWFNSGKNW